MTSAYPLFQALRPRQWIKQAFVFIPLLLAQRLFDLPALLRTLEAAAIFCLFTGAVYLINDLVDLESDRRHPVRKLRPLAAGLLSPALGGGAAALLLLASLAWGALLGQGFLQVLAAYLAVQVLYNVRLKKTPVLDILSIAASFFLRVLAGAAAIPVPVSRWLIVFSAFLSMYIALGKFKHEPQPPYDHALLDQMFGVLSAGMLSSYVVYCTSSETIARLGTDRLIITFPFVLYAVLRYLYLVHEQTRPGVPRKAYMFDPSLLASVVLWALLSVLILRRAL